MSTSAEKMQSSLSRVTQGGKLRADLQKSVFFGDKDDLYKAVSSSNAHSKAGSIAGTIEDLTSETPR